MKLFLDNTDLFSCFKKLTKQTLCTGFNYWSCTIVVDIKQFVIWDVHIDYVRSTQLSNSKNLRSFYIIHSFVSLRYVSTNLWMIFCFCESSLPINGKFDSVINPYFTIIRIVLILLVNTDKEIYLILLII